MVNCSGDCVSTEGRKLRICSILRLEVFLVLVFIFRCTRVPFMLLSDCPFERHRT